MLLTTSGRAHELAALLDEINRERRSLEAGMREDAEAQVDRAFVLSGTVEPALAVFDPSFHEGVVGIIASRLKDRLHRPAFVFALGQDGALKGSGRSIDGFHLRDALDLVSKRHPGLLLRFGGHAMAAGCTLARADLETFRGALQLVAAEGLGASAAERTIVNDGPLAAAHFEPATVRLLEGQVWGAAFDARSSATTVEVVSQRLVGDKHLKLALRVGGVMREAIWFGRSEPVASASASPGGSASTPTTASSASDGRRRDRIAHRQRIGIATVAEAAAGGGDAQRVGVGLDGIDPCRQRLPAGVEQRVHRDFEERAHERRRAGVADADPVERQTQLRAGGDQATFDLDTLAAHEREAGEARPAGKPDPVGRREGDADVVDPAVGANEVGQVGGAHAQFAAAVGERDEAILRASTTTSRSSNASRSITGARSRATACRRPRTR